MQDLKVFFRENGQKILTGFLGLLLIFQFSGFVSAFSSHIDPRSILSSRDADAAHVVGTAYKTRWYKDNGESGYGAFFYRVAHTFSFFTGRTFADKASPYENGERATHLVLMVLNLLCVYGIALMLASLLTSSWPARLGITLPLTALFLRNSTWAEFVYRAHPDMLFGLVVLAAFVTSSKALNAPQSVWFKIAALLWGAAGMVKLTFVIFLPVIWLMWMPPFTRQNARTAFEFYLWMLPSYLLLGFPQSFNFPRSIRFLLDQSKFGLAPTAQSFETWVNHLTSQLLFPLLAIFLLALVSPLVSARVGRFRMLAIAALPLIIIFRQNTEYQMSYYLIPIVAINLAWAALYGRGMLTRFLPARAFSRVVIYFAALVFLTIGFVPASIEAGLTPTLGCRSEAAQISQAVRSYVEQGRVVALDPYIAFDRHQAGKKASSNWANNWARLNEIEATAFALSRNYAAGFTQADEPRHGTKVDVPNWPESKAFYLTFAEGKTETTDPSGRRWTRTLATEKCGWEIWTRE